MNRTIKAREDRNLTERELDAVTGGRILPPNATDILPFVPTQPTHTTPIIPHGSIPHGSRWY
jgi:hypothetical protein